MSEPTTPAGASGDIVARLEKIAHTIGVILADYYKGSEITRPQLLEDAQFLRELAERLRAPREADEATVERALAMPTNSEIKLAAGELTAGELRAVRAVLEWRLKAARAALAARTEA